MNPPDGLSARIESLLGSHPVSWSYRSGGFSIAGRWTVELADGRRVFAKLATTDDIATRLREEHKNMSVVDSDLRCGVLAWDDGMRPLLVVEDLSHGRWPPPWEVGDVERVREMLERMWSTAVPGDVIPSAEKYRDAIRGWGKVAENREPIMSLHMCTSSWLDEALPLLLEAERNLVLEGDDLIHLDVRSDNICFLEDRVLLVDWNFAARGRRDLDLSFWLPSLRLEGGPLPEEIETGIPNAAAAVAGLFAVAAGLPPPEGAPTVRRHQQRQLRITLPWACRELGLPEPDGDWATVEIETAHSDLAAGRIDEATWYERVEEPLTDSYLSHVQLWRQSGKGGDEVDWRWGRELTLDLANDGDSILDVGCANGFLMESLHRWGTERGLRIEPYGVDISWRLASLARRRLPHWADHIWTANVMQWTPPKRFEIVHTALDCMPPHKRREHIERVLAEFLVPDGRLVLRAARMPADPGKDLEDLGFRPDGVIDSVHPRSNDVRRAAWMKAPVG